MRIVLYVILLHLIFTISWISPGNATSPDCNSCHTMYDNQSSITFEDSIEKDLMLSEGCVSCHTAATGMVSSYGAPVVLHTMNPGGQGAARTLAGGDFFWVNTNETGDSTKGHNVIDLPGITKKDANFRDYSPPGWDKLATAGYVFGNVAGGEDTWSKQLTCAGKYGCHGNHIEENSFQAVKGAHHDNLDGTATRALTANTIGGSYRFLAGIKGLEDPDWNWSETAVTHNEYYGENSVVDRSSGANYGNKATISFLCAKCHGLLHSVVDSNGVSKSPWLRHPTDIVIPDRGEYALYNTENGLTIGPYSVEAPVARAFVPAISGSQITPGKDIVMCLSCHRAHGSNYEDLLRWDYGNMVVGSAGTGGCFTCHNGKSQSH